MTLTASPKPSHSAPPHDAQSPRDLEITSPESAFRRHAVELINVSKSFATRAAVRNLSLRVPERSICGFIGPNGSGKTTTLRLIMRIYEPDPGAGAIRVLGEEGFGAASDRVGYLPEERGLYKRMKVGDILRFYAELKGCQNVKGAVDEWLQKMRLTDAVGKRVDALSKGMAQKVQFIAAVINNPELVILDEPFSGLDPVNAEVLRDAVLELRDRGATVIFSTHDMNAAERMCDFVVMIYQGDKVLDGTMASIRSQFGSDTIRTQVEDAGACQNDLPGVVSVRNYGQMQELRLSPEADSQRILRRLMQRTQVWRFELAHPSLHDIFVRIAAPPMTEGF